MSLLISEGAKRLNLNIVDKGKGDYELVELFTTHDGEWEPSSKMFSIPQWARKYLPGFTSAGAATHAMVRVEDENRQPVTIGVHIGNAIVSTANKPEMWAIQQINGSYAPDRGEHGWWKIDFDAARQRIEGIGLPLNNHVSVFAVYRKVKQIVAPPTQPGTINVPVNVILEVEQRLKQLQQAVDKLR